MFQPNISQSSKWINENSKNFSGNMKDFYDRQNAFLQRQQEKRQDAASKYGEQAQCTFKPEINLTSEIICESDPVRGVEHPTDKYERLYAKDKKKQEVIREMMEQEVYKEYTFQPKINKISKAIAQDFRQELLSENMSNPLAKEKFEQKKQEYIREKESQNTF